jgi:hypothetical protein
MTTTIDPMDLIRTLTLPDFRRLEADVLRHVRRI